MAAPLAPSLLPKYTLPAVDTGTVTLPSAPATGPVSVAVAPVGALVQTSTVSAVVPSAVGVTATTIAPVPAAEVSFGASRLSDALGIAWNSAANDAAFTNFGPEHDSFADTFGKPSESEDVREQDGTALVSESQRQTATALWQALNASSHKRATSIAFLDLLFGDAALELVGAGAEGDSAEGGATQ